MKTFHLDPDTRERTSLVVEEIERLLSAGKHIAVTVAEEQELLSPQQVADRLGFSHEHVVRLITAGELEARKLPGLPDSTSKPSATRPGRSAASAASLVTPWLVRESICMPAAANAVTTSVTQAGGSEREG